MKRAMTALGVVALFANSAHADIVIGVAGPMTGQNAAFGQYMKSGVEAAVAAINAKGGINGEKLVVSAADDQCDIRRTTDVANQLAAADARLVVGHFCSNASTAAAKVYAERDVMMITPSASAPRLTDENNATTLRLANRDDTQATTAALRIRQDDPAARVVIIDDGTPNAKALAARFIATTAPAATVIIKLGEKNLAAAAAKIAAANATAIYFACGGIEAGGILSEYRAGGGLAKAYGSDAVLVDAFWERAGTSGEGTLATFPPDPQAAPDAREVVSAMNAANQPPEGPALAAYAAVQVFVEAHRANPSANAKAQTAWLRRGQPVKTILGPVAFDAKGDLSPQKFDWYRWSNGAYSKVSEGN